MSRLPVNEAARIAEDLAAVLTGTYPYDPLVRSLVSRHRILAMGSLRPPRGRATDRRREEPELPAPGPLPTGDRLRPIALRLCESGG